MRKEASLEQWSSLYEVAANIKLKVKGKLKVIDTFAKVFNEHKF